MKMSDAGLIQLAGLEGIVVAPYLDTEKVWTYGVGHTKAAGGRDPEMMFRGMPEDVDAEVRVALKMFKEDVVNYENTVNAALTVPATQTEFDALVSFHYNTGGIRRAKLTKKMNAGDKEAAAAGFMGWLKPPEIIGRRKKEQRLFANGQYTGEAVNVYGVKASGAVNQRPLKTYQPFELLDILGHVSATPSAKKRTTPVGKKTLTGAGILGIIVAIIGGLAKLFGG